MVPRDCSRPLDLIHEGGIFLFSPINSGVIAMLGGLVVVPVVSWITPKLKKESVDDIVYMLQQKSNSRR